MIETKKVNGKALQCFVVKRGEPGGNDVLIPLVSLTAPHYQMLKVMDAKADARKSELIDIMKDTTLDNGVNALKFFRGLLQVVPVPTKEKEVLVDEPAPKPRRGRRPKADSAE